MCLFLHVRGKTIHRVVLTALCACSQRGNPQQVESVARCVEELEGASTPYKSSLGQLAEFGPPFFLCRLVWVDCVGSVFWRLTRHLAGPMIRRNFLRLASVWHGWCSSK